jgi:PKD repeat protein
MKTSLRFATALLLFASTWLTAQNVQRPSTLPATTATSTVSRNAQTINGNPSQDVQMVTCTDKVTYCDRHPQTNQDFYLGGTVGWEILMMKFPEFTGQVTAGYASLRRVGANCPVRIVIWALDGNGDPTGGYLAYVDATVNSASAAEYGGNLSSSPTVTNGFAMGVLINSSNPSDSVFLMARNDPDQWGLSYYYYGTSLYNAQTDFGDEIDFLIRPRISFTGPTVTASATPTSGCVGTPISFYSNGSGYPNHYNGNYSYGVYNVCYSTQVSVPDPVYAWNFGDATTSAVQSPSHTYSATGSYTATCTWTYTGWTTACPTTPGTVPISISGVTPSLTISESANPVCPNQSVTFTATPTNGGPAPTYVWKKNGVPVGSSSTYAATGWVGGDVMTCEMVSNAACAPTTPVVSNSIIMYTQPLAYSSYNYVATGLSVSFTATSPNAVSWAWNFGDAGTSASATPVHNYATGGTYTVDLTTTNSCGQTNVSSINITISSSTNSNGGNTSVNEKDLQVNVNVFPNPVNNDLNIQYALNHPTDATVEILNTLGQVVSSQIIQSASTGTAYVSMENIANGIYFVRFTAADQVQMTKIVRQ